MKKILVGVSACISAVMALATNSFAVLSADQLAVTSAIDTMITDLATWGWTAILAVITFVIGAKLFKRFVGSST